MCMYKHALEEGLVRLISSEEIVTVLVENRGRRLIQLRSHLHFFEVDGALCFERWKAYGRRLNIPAGAAIRIRPGQRCALELVNLAC